MSNTIVFIHGAWMTPRCKATYNKQRHSSAQTDLLEFADRTHWIIAQDGGDSGDRIRFVLGDSVDPFDLKALPAKDLDGGSWQQALIRPHLAWWQFRVQLDLSRTHMYPQVVPLIVCLVGMQDGRHPQTILELRQRRSSR